MNGKSIIKFAVVAAAVACVATARVYAAAGINLNVDNSVYLGLNNGNALPAGDAVYMGIFNTLSDAQIAALMTGGTVTPAGYAALVADFQPLNGIGLRPVGAGTSPDAGAMETSYNGNQAAFASASIHLLVVNTASTSGATQVGVFTGIQTTANSWDFPANMNSGVKTISADGALTTPLIGAYAAGLNAAAKGYTFDNVSGNSYGTINSLELATIVPEPSSILLVVTGLVGLLGLRRRR